MLRSFIIYISKANWAKNIVTNWTLGKKMASRFIAGEKLEDAIRVIEVLNSRGIYGTLDHLGEDSTTDDKACKATGEILKALDAITASGVRANVSIKLSQIGLKLDYELCSNNLKAILEYANKYDNYIRIDMEDSSTTQKTLDLFYQMCRDGCNNAGIVIQAYLYRSDADVRKLAQDGYSMRLCKGAYKEPPEVAFPHKKDVDNNYYKLAECMMEEAQKSGVPHLSQSGKIPPLVCLATHDINCIEHGKVYAQKIGLPKGALEFQMLHGIRRDLQEQLVQEGYPVRIYVPYGTDWYPYFMRRLAERPANVWFIMSNLLRR